MTQLDSTPQQDTLARYLRERHDEILRDWQQRVRPLPRSSEQSQGRLLDAIPDLLGVITELVEKQDVGGALDLDLLAHANQRRRASFDLHHVITEIALLRDCILARCERERRPCSIRELRVLDVALDRVVLSATELYVATAVRFLRTLDRISTQMLEAVCVEDVLDGLMQALEDEMTSVDSSAVLLRDDGEFRLRAFRGPEDGLGALFRHPVGSRFAAKIASERRAMYLSADELDDSGLSHHGFRAVYGLPLLHRSALIGVACVGSCTSSDFSTVDGQLLESLAVRAAGAVHLQLLRDASEQRARQLAESEARLQRILLEQRASEERARFLAKAGHLVSSSLEYRATLARLADMVVPELADFCTVDVVREDGSLGDHVAVAHRDPAKIDLVRAMRSRYGPSDALIAILHNRGTTLVPEVSDESLRAAARDEAHHSMLRALAPRSAIVVPLVARDRVFGALSLVQSESGRRFGHEHAELAEELARMASTAIENARLHEETERAVELRDRILALVSHDLKTPLTAIDLSGAVLQQRPPIQADAFTAKQMDVIRRNAARMSRLIGDLLDMASLQSGRLTLEPRPCPLAPLLHECLESQLPMARETSVELILRASDPETMQVSCDRDRIYQVLSNLIGNAMKFCVGGGVVTVSAAQEGEFAVIRVSDTGPGIEPEHLPHVFELFWKGRDGGRRGTGIGLYIARGIVEAHGGRMWVESEPGRGSVFSFTLRKVAHADGS